MDTETEGLIDQYIKANKDHDWVKSHELYLKIKERQDNELALITGLKRKLLDSLK